MDGADSPATGLLDGWLTRAEVAAEFGIAEDTLRRWEGKKIGPPSVKLGQRVLYRKDSVREWLRSKERAPAAAR